MYTFLNSVLNRHAVNVYPTDRESVAGDRAQHRTAPRPIVETKSLGNQVYTIG